MNVGSLELQTWVAPIPSSNSTCSAFRTMLISGTSSSRQTRSNIWPRFDAAAVCTNAVCPSRRMVSTMPNDVRGLTKQDALRRRDAPVLRVHRSPDQSDGSPDQRLGGTIRARSDHDTGTFVAHRQRLTDACRHSPHQLVRDGCRKDGIVGIARRLHRRWVRGSEQQTQVGRVDRRCLDAHQHFVIFGSWDGNRGERQLERAIGFDHRTQL